MAVKIRLKRIGAKKTPFNYCALYEMAKDLPLLPLHTPPLDKPSTAGFR